MVDITKTFVSKGEVGVLEILQQELALKTGDTVEVLPAPRHKVLGIIKKKIKKAKLAREDFFRLMHAIDSNNLSDAEMASFVTAVAINGLTDDEIINLIDAIIDTGEKLKLSNKHVITKHSIGGIPGNRVTPIIVPIIAAAGLTMPKISTRAITSPSGTIDTVEIFMPTNLSIEEIRTTLEKVNGSIFSNEKADICSGMGKLIRILTPLSMDPEPLLVASILAHLKALSANHILIDIPAGKGSKIMRLKGAEYLALKFVTIGKKIEIDTESVVTPGDRPIGSYIGPALEAYDILNLLKNRKGSQDLLSKAINLAGILLEMSNKASPGSGAALAKSIVDSGKAYQKWREIIEMQGGNPNITLSDIPLGNYTVEFKSFEDGTLYGIDNKAVNEIAKAAGAPFDKGAGVVLLRKKGEHIKKGESLARIYSNSETKLSEALNVAQRRNPYVFERMILKRYKVMRPE